MAFRLFTHFPTFAFDELLLPFDTGFVFEGGFYLIVAVDAVGWPRYFFPP